MELSILEGKNLSHSPLIEKNLFCIIQVGKKVHSFRSVAVPGIPYKPEDGDAIISLKNHQTETIMYVRTIPLGQLPPALELWVAVYPPGDPQNMHFDLAAPRAAAPQLLVRVAPAAKPNGSVPAPLGAPGQQAAAADAGAWRDEAAERATARVAELEETIRTLRTQHEQQASAAQDADNSCAKTARAVDDLQRTLLDTQQKINDAEAARSEAHAAVTEVLAAREPRRAELMDMRNELSRTRTSNQAHVESVKASARSLEADLARAEDDLAAMNAEIAVYEAKTDQLAARQADLQTSEKLAQALELLTTQLTQVKAKRDAEAPAVRERERAAAVAEQERLEDMAKLEVMNAELKRKRDASARLQDEVGALRSKVDAKNQAAAAHIGQVARLEGQLGESKQQLIDMQRRVEDLENTKRSYAMESDTRADPEALDAVLKSTFDKKQHLDKQAEALEATLKVSSTEADGLNASILEMEATEQREAAELRDVQLAVTQLQGNDRRLRQELDETAQVGSQRELQLLEALSACEELDRVHGELDRDAAAADRSHADSELASQAKEAALKAKFQSLKTDHEKIGDSLAGLREKGNASASRKEVVDAELLQSRSELRNVLETVASLQAEVPAVDSSTAAQIRAAKETEDEAEATRLKVIEVRQALKAMQEAASSKTSLVTQLSTAVAEAQQAAREAEEASNLAKTNELTAIQAAEVRSTARAREIAERKTAYAAAVEELTKRQSLVEEEQAARDRAASAVESSRALGKERDASAAQAREQVGAENATLAQLEAQHADATAQVRRFEEGGALAPSVEEEQRAEAEQLAVLEAEVEEAERAVAQASQRAEQAARVAARDAGLLQARIAERGMQDTQLRSLADDLQSAQATLAVLQASNESLRKRLETLKEEDPGAISSEVVAMTLDRADILEREYQVQEADLEREIHRAESDLLEGGMTSKALGSKIEDLEQTRAVATAKANELADRLPAIKKAVEQKVAEQENTRRELASAGQRKLDLQAKLAETRRSVEALNKQVAGLESELSHAEPEKVMAALAAAEAELRVAEREAQERERAEKEDGELRGRAETLRREVAELKKPCGLARDLVLEHEASSQATEQEQAASRAEVLRLEAELEVVMSESASRYEEMQELEDRKQQLEEELKVLAMGFADMEMEKNDLDRSNYLAQESIETKHGGSVVAWAADMGVSPNPPELAELKAAAARVHAEMEAREAAHRAEVDKVLAEHREQLLRGDFPPMPAADGGRRSAAPSPETVPQALHLQGLVQLSQPRRGRRKALLIGCNYEQSHAPLKGARNDAWNLQSMLRYCMLTDAKDIRVLVDEAPASGTDAAVEMPTKANIMESVRWLVQDIGPNDSVVLSFSGYGAQVAVNDRGECSGFLVPTDFADSANTDAYHLVNLADILGELRALPVGSSALLLLDACHAVVPAMGTSSVFPPVARGRVDYSKLKDFVVRPRFLALPRSGPGTRALAPPVAPPLNCSLVALSACNHSEFCAEFPIEGTVQGAFTWAIVQAFSAAQFTLGADALNKAVNTLVRDLTRHFKGITQTPTLTCSGTAEPSDIVL